MLTEWLTDLVSNLLKKQHLVLNTFVCTMVTARLCSCLLEQRSAAFSKIGSACFQNVLLRLLEAYTPQILRARSDMNISRVSFEARKFFGKEIAALSLRSKADSRTALSGSVTVRTLLVYRIR